MATPKKIRHKGSVYVLAAPYEDGTVDPIEQEELNKKEFRRNLKKLGLTDSKVVKVYEELEKSGKELEASIHAVTELFKKLDEAGINAFTRSGQGHSAIADLMRYLGEHGDKVSYLQSYATKAHGSMMALLKSAK